jgi:hypothetical protein
MDLGVDRVVEQRLALVHGNVQVDALVCFQQPLKLRFIEFRDRKQHLLAPRNVEVVTRPQVCSGLISRLVQLAQIARCGAPAQARLPTQNNVREIGSYALPGCRMVTL